VPALVVERNGTIADLFVTAPGQHDIGRALGDHGDAAVACGICVQCAHALPFRGERNLAYALEPAASPVDEPCLVFGDEECGFGGVA
jgi:hypothetical protein